jgi:hypothetical protein
MRGGGGGRIQRDVDAEVLQRLDDELEAFFDLLCADDVAHGDVRNEAP